MDDHLFRRAARDGFLPTLSQATRRDCNAPDEDGMTATLWAAHEGHLDALRLIVGRGGDPDRSDHYGNTALHCAAAMGHMNCVTFLVNFGANLWALDNDLHSAKELAAIRGRDTVLHYLDTVIDKQEQTNHKTVRMLKEKSLRDAQRRIREFDRQQQKLDRKAIKHETKLSQHRTKTSNENDRSKAFGLVSTLSKSTSNLLGISREKHLVDVSLNPKFSDLTLGGSKNGKSPVPNIGWSRRLKQNRQPRDSDFIVSDVRNGQKSLRSLSGLRRDNQIIYVSKHQASDKNGSDDSVSWSSRSGIESEPSLFDRPGFGSVAFRTCVSTSLSCLNDTKSTRRQQQQQQQQQHLVLEEQQEEEQEQDDEAEEMCDKDGENREGTGVDLMEDRVGSSRFYGRHQELAARDSIGSAGSLAGKSQRSLVSPMSRADTMSSADWLPPDDTADDDTAEDAELAALQLFLTAAGVAEFLPNFADEQIDLASLALLDETDLASLGLPLGPRRKLINALVERKNALDSPGCISDTKL